MTQFTNQAQISYNGVIINSNVAVGEIVDILSATKNATPKAYITGDNVTYIISVTNTGNTAVSGVSISDDLGAYSFDSETLYPLTYVADSVLVYINGTLQATPTVNAGPPLTISGLTIPANSNMIIVYNTTVNSFAPLGSTGSITNTATITGASITNPVTATTTIPADQTPRLSITKSINPTTVAENGTVTYTFIIENYGNTQVSGTGGVILSDTFNPILSNVSVTYNDTTAWSANTQYTYDQSSGNFATIDGNITVPAATYSQDPSTGSWETAPGAAKIEVTGTI